MDGIGAWVSEFPGQHYVARLFPLRCLLDDQHIVGFQLQICANLTAAYRRQIHADQRCLALAAIHHFIACQLGIACIR
jgi:hypothetical protein